MSKYCDELSDYAGGNKMKCYFVPGQKYYDDKDRKWKCQKIISNGNTVLVVVTRFVVISAIGVGP